MAPVTRAPTTGMKEPMKTRTLRGRARGTPMMAAPAPMPTASTNATNSWMRA